ncbi:MAG: DUF2846 domain-containing protein [Desulfovibrio sp.]|jgi:hypothetical protein|nr:DUF2846 domain-containing protein [Desulfovibrio sp.]
MAVTMNMRRIVHALLVVSLLLAVVGCTRGQMAQHGDYVYEANPKILKPDESSAVVYFMRDSPVIGGANYFILEDNERIGLLKSGTYFIHRTAPGKHIYWIDLGDEHVAVKLDIQAGQTYYVEHVYSYTFALSEISKVIADKMLPKLKYIRPSTEEDAAQIRAKEAGQ